MRRLRIWVLIYTPHKSNFASCGDITILIGSFFGTSVHATTTPLRPQRNLSGYQKVTCNMHNRGKGWLTLHITRCHQASEKASTPAPTPATPTTVNRTRMPATTTSELKCPLCTNILPTGKVMINHCLTRRRYSVLKGAYMSETTVGTTARSSESRLGLPGNE